MMAYEPTEWEAGMKVTASRLNKLEQGVANAGGVMIVHDNSDTLDKTFAEIRNALADGTMVIIPMTHSGSASLEIVSAAVNMNGDYNVYIMATDFVYIAASENDYPVLNKSPDVN